MRYAFFLVLLLLVSCTSKYFYYPNLESLNGSVKAVYEKSSVVTYDSNRVAITGMDDSMSVFYVNKYYSRSSFPVKTELFLHDSTIAKVIKRTRDNSRYEFDKDGRLISKTMVLNITKDSVISKTYNPTDNNLIREDYIYYKDGRVVSQVSCDFQKQMTTRFDFQYDVNSEVIRQIFTLYRVGMDNISDTSLIRYLDKDQFGNWTRRIRYNRDESDKCSLTIRHIKYH